MFDSQKGDKFVKIEIRFLFIEGVNSNEGGSNKDPGSSNER